MPLSKSFTPTICFDHCPKWTTSIHDKYHYDMCDASFTFMDQVWQLSPATVCGNTVSAVLPENARGYYLAVCYEINGQQMITTSVYTAL